VNRLAKPRGCFESIDPFEIDRVPYDFEAASLNAVIFRRVVGCSLTYGEQTVRFAVRPSEKHSFEPRELNLGSRNIASRGTYNVGDMSNTCPLRGWSNDHSHVKQTFVDDVDLIALK
jgi:hypothetical protein